MYILASKSPRREELLKKLIDNFVVIPSKVDESKICAPIEMLPKVLSLAKAQDVFKSHPHDTIIAADTVVILNGKIFGKPHTKEVAYQMLRELSNQTHLVITGFTILSQEKLINKSVVTKVQFENLTEELIYQYVNTCNPLDKAGAYGIQDHGFKLIKEINGSYYNVMGLPIEELKLYL